jgi:hypothetical protein
MKWLLWLYPRDWRKRYGDEFLALLEQNGVSMPDFVDILIGAAIARMRPSTAATTVNASRTGGLALMLAALIWLTVPPTLSHLDFRLGLDETYSALVHTGTVMLTLVVVGCTGYRQRIAHEGRSLMMTTLVYRVIVAASLVYLFADGLVSTHVLSVWGPLIILVVLGVFSTTLLSLGLMASIAVVGGTLRWWATLPLLVVLLLGCVSLAMFITFYGENVAPAWSPAVYMGLYVMIGISWFLLGLALLAGSGRERRHISLHRP